MPVVVGVEFEDVGKVYHFDPQNLLDLGAHDWVLVDTAGGVEVARVVQPPHTIADDDVVGDMKTVVRRAGAWDMVQRDLWQRKEAEALAICRSKVRESRLDMKVVRCDYNFDGGRLLIFFSSEARIDFRTLVRELARIFRTRIEMRQIGVRDEAKLLDGVGKCGRQLCCTSWLREFTPVSIRMAKNQGLPLNPDEISGVCGRLLCCLSYEDAHYKEQNKKMPKLGAEVITPQGAGRVRHVHPLKETVTVLLEGQVFAEFGIADLISSKTAAGGSCSTCGGCTTKRRAGAEEDNKRYKEQKAQSEQSAAPQAAAAAPQEPPAPQGKAADAGESAEVDGSVQPSGGKRRRRRRR